jgi:hypothetical protein
MTIALALIAQLSAAALAGPDLVEVERAVAKCDGGAMTKIFGAEPQRRRAALIAVFNEQQAIVSARQALAQRRFEAAGKPASPPDVAPIPAPNFDLEAQALADRQQRLDDSRMLGGLRDNALDMMRQHYLTGCNGALTGAGGAVSSTK